MKNRNWFWGVFFLLSAVFVIASQTGSFGEIGFLSILATVLLVALFIKSIIKLEFFGIFLSLAFLYMIYWKPLDLMQISIWLLLLAAILASIGFSLIFKKRYKKGVFCEHCHGFHKDNEGFEVDLEHFEHSSENIDDNNPYAKVSLSGSSKYLHGDCIKSGQFIVSLGALELFFDQAQLSPEGAEIFLDCSLGSIKLYIPKQWNVTENLHVTLGEVENNKRFNQPEENAPQLSLVGNVHLGSVEIQYI